jgi:DNA polymerase (family 10)
VKIEMSHIKNTQIAKKLYEIADLLELKGVSFKPRAYRRAAQNIESLADDIGTYHKKEKLQDIPGVGESIAEKVEEILETGELEYLKDLKKDFPEGLLDMMDIQGLGPKKLMKLYKNLDITNIDELEKAAKDEKIRDLEGFGKTSEQNILEGLEMFRRSQERFILGHILPISNEIEEKLKNQKEVNRIAVAGSIRRRKETIGDVDILITSEEPEEIMDFFTKLPQVNRVLSKGKTKSTIITADDLQIDLRVVADDSFGSALQYFTGSKAHNIKLRRLALDKNWKLSEYGLTDNETNEKIAGKEENKIYEALGLAYIEPELREDRGEVEAALEENLPELIKREDIKGDLHIHTKWSEGNHTIEEMAEEAIKKGHEYIAICDHSGTLQIAQGLKDEEIREQIKEIDNLNEKMDDIEIFRGIEANIDKNGKLDVKNEVLKDLDFVVASIHHGFKKSQKEQTDRIVTAMHNEYVNAIGHPTGRMLNKREPYDLDITKIFETAEDLGVSLELNSQPDRLDLSDVNCLEAKKFDLKIVINTDSHNKNHLRYVDLGVATARRGWLEKENILNTLNLSNLKKYLNL